MIKNNIEVDVKIKCIETGMTQAQLGESIGYIGQHVNWIMKKSDSVMNKTFISIIGSFGL